jgi:peptidoglycan L-alanyl-D-glutamate endopeptidase CwlK
MTYTLGAKSRANLQGVHPDLVRVVERAIQLTDQDFAVHDGCRTIEEQREFVRRGVSKTMRSRHLTNADGFGHAVDLVPFINGQLRWEWPPIYHVAAAMREAADECGVVLVWGGVWDRPLSEINGDWRAMEHAVSSYCARHPGPDFIDGPHFELAVHIAVGKAA